MLHRAYLVIILVAAVTLSGCGFQMRDDYQLPQIMQKVSVEAADYSEFTKILSQRLTLAGAEVTAAGLAPITIRIIEDSLDRRTLSLSQSGQVAEYELIYTVNYQLETATSSPQPFTVEVYRDYQDDPNFALAKTREREVLVSEMRDQAARQVLRQLLAHLAE